MQTWETQNSATRHKRACNAELRQKPGAVFTSLLCGCLISSSKVPLQQYVYPTPLCTSFRSRKLDAIILPFKNRIKVNFL